MHHATMQLALQSSGKNKQRGLTTRKKLTALLALPEYIQNRKRAASTRLPLTWFWKERKKRLHATSLALWLPLMRRLPSARLSLIAFVSLISSKGPCAEGLAPSLWCHWKWGSWKRKQWSLGGCAHKGDIWTLGPSPFLFASLLPKSKQASANTGLK